MRLEISTSCSRVSNGTCPICFRYIRTGSSITELSVRVPPSRAFPAGFATAGSSSTSPTTSISIFRNFSMISSIPSGLATSGGR
jgi:hypothetical protein